MRDRPARVHIPIAVKREVAARQGDVCQCGCETPIWTGRKCNVEWDHCPALRLREINRAGDDYTLPQNDPRYIVARCRASHAAKTRGHGATTHRSDMGEIGRERRRGRKMKPKPKWAKGKKIPARPFQRRSP